MRGAWQRGAWRLHLLRPGGAHAGGNSPREMGGLEGLPSKAKPSLHEKLTQRTFALQTYEGGLGGEPGNEAHGGYTFCGLAALMLVGRAAVLDLPSLLHWAVHRQVSPGPRPACSAETCMICPGS